MIIRTAEGYTAVGGTLEPGEHWCVAASRELMEEAGARLLGSSPDRPVIHPFGQYRCHTSAPAPYRENLPFPDLIRVLSWAEVELVGPPTSPPGGEIVGEVLVLSVDDACSHLDRDHAAVYRLAFNSPEERCR